MRRADTIWILPCVGLAACSFSPDPRQMVRVGYMERDCSRVRNDDRIPSIPVGLTVTPVEASKALPNGCFTKFFVDVYADEENYYFFDNTPAVFSFSSMSAERVRACSFVVDGRSGQLIRPPQRQWNGSPYEPARSVGRAQSAESTRQAEAEPGASTTPSGPLPQDKIRP